MSADLILLPVPAAEAALFAACAAPERPESARLARRIDDLTAAGALTPAHAATLLMFGGHGVRPSPGTDAHRLWAGAMSTLSAALA